MTERQMIVVESPLKGDTVRNLLYSRLACRQLYEAGYAPIASHMNCPWFMDDRVAQERRDGIDWPWMWQPGVPHMFMKDLGVSDGMRQSIGRCKFLGIPLAYGYLSEQKMAWFRRGEIYTHTPGFEVVK